MCDYVNVTVCAWWVFEAIGANVTTGGDRLYLVRRKALSMRAVCQPPQHIQLGKQTADKLVEIAWVPVGIGRSVGERKSNCVVFDFLQSVEF